MRRAARLPCLVCLLVAFSTLFFVVSNFERVFSNSKHMVFVPPAKWDTAPQKSTGIVDNLAVKNSRINRPVGQRHEENTSDNHFAKDNSNARGIPNKYNTHPTTRHLALMTGTSTSDSTTTKTLDVRNWKSTRQIVLITSKQLSEKHFDEQNHQKSEILDNGSGLALSYLRNMGKQTHDTNGRFKEQRFTVNRQSDDGTPLDQFDIQKKVRTNSMNIHNRTDTEAGQVRHNDVELDIENKIHSQHEKLFKDRFYPEKGEIQMDKDIMIPLEKSKSVKENVDPNVNQEERKVLKDLNNVRFLLDSKKEKNKTRTNPKQDKSSKTVSQNIIKQQLDKRANGTLKAEQETNNITFDIEFVHKQRLQQIRKVCNSIEGKKRKPLYPFLFSKKDKLACKTLPKAGSTFMIQLFGLLNGNSDKNMWTQSRKKLHGGENIPYRESFTLEALNSYTVMRTVRNPYSRLFSAYIDKVFLPSNAALTYDIIKYIDGGHENKCKFQVSFEDFLIYATHPNSNRAHLRGHYGPIVKDRHLFDCQYRDFILVKHETFSQDVLYALEKVRADERIIEKVKQLMFKQNARSNVVTTIKTVFDKRSTNISIFKQSRCFWWKDLALRLWKAFQIQGYINRKSNFPWRMFQSTQSYSDANYIAEVFLKEIEARPLSSLEKSEQREYFFTKAYDSVSRETMTRVKRMYSMDFKMYQYDVDQF